MEEALRPKYNLKDLRVRKVGSDRKDFGSKNIHLEPDKKNSVGSKLFMGW
jgi:hypothetical protein